MHFGVLRAYSCVGFYGNWTQWNTKILGRRKCEMQKRLKKGIIAKVVSFVLILTMLMPQVVVADVEWFGLQELEALYVVEEFESEDYAEKRLLDLLTRMEEFDVLTAEEQWLVHENFGMNEDKASHSVVMGLADVEKWRRAREENDVPSGFELEQAYVAGLLSGSRNYSDLGECDRHLIFKRLNIVEESFEIVDELFKMMERDGFGLHASVEMIWIISSGLFDYSDAQVVLQSIPSDFERIMAVTEFERFAQTFDIADRVNERRLVDSVFATTNVFGEELVERRTNDNEQREILESNQIEQTRSRFSFVDVEMEYTIFVELTNEAAFVEALGLFLAGHHPAEIEEVFAIGAALHAEQYLAMQQRDNGTRLEEWTMPAFAAEFAANAIHIASDELELFIEYGLSILNFSVTPFSAAPPERDVPIINPFGHANNTVSINTGAATFRENIASLEGRNGFGISLDLVYNSADAEIRRPTVFREPGGVMSNRALQRHAINGFNFVGWKFDLPYFVDGLLYVPGRGSFQAWAQVPAIRDGAYNIAIVGYGRRAGDTLAGMSLMRVQPSEFRQRNLINNLTATHALRFGDGTTYYFNNGRIIAMVDRFFNTIQFEYDFHGRMTRIIEDSGAAIRFEQNIEGSISVVDGENNRVRIDVSNVYDGSGNGVGSVQIDAIERVGVGAKVVFEYAMHDTSFNFRTPSTLLRPYPGWRDPNSYVGREVQANYVLLLTSVTFPTLSRLRFEYESYVGNIGDRGARQEWRVSERWKEDIFCDEIYEFTTFVYESGATQFEFGTSSPQIGHRYSVVVTQSTGLRTNYTFDHWHLNVEQRTYDSAGVNLLVVYQRVEYNRQKLPIEIVLTEYLGEYANMRRRVTEQHFEYNSYGQVTRVLSQLAGGDVSNRIYWTEYTYGISVENWGIPIRSGGYMQPLTRTFWVDENTKIREVNLLSDPWTGGHVSGDRGSVIARTYVYEYRYVRGVLDSRTRSSRTDFGHDNFGNVTEIREFLDAYGGEYVRTQVEYSRGVMPSVIRTFGVSDAEGGLFGGTGVVEQRFEYDGNCWSFAELCARSRTKFKTRTARHATRACGE